jgi:deazaflavin-dependent oxidoreductase (nitroreductase family)
MLKRISTAAAIAAFVALAVTVTAWRRDRRLGSRFVNVFVNPLVLGRGLSGGTHSELAVLEHVGRTSGITRYTPVRPVATGGGFRIVAPLGEQSHWARNVLAAGHCRLRWHDTIYELDEPRLIPASECTDLARPVRLFAVALGLRYMRLRLFGKQAGTFAAPVEADLGVQVPEAVTIPEQLPVAL